MSKGDDQLAVELREQPGKSGTLDAAILKQVTLDDGTASTAPAEAEVDDNGTAEDQESNEDANDIDLVFTDIVSPL